MLQQKIQDSINNTIIPKMHNVIFSTTLSTIKAEDNSKNEFINKSQKIKQYYDNLIKFNNRYKRQGSAEYSVRSSVFTPVQKGSFYDSFGSKSSLEEFRISHQDQESQKFKSQKRLQNSINFSNHQILNNQKIKNYFDKQPKPYIQTANYECDENDFIQIYDEQRPEHKIENLKQLRVSEMKFKVNRKKSAKQSILDMFNQYKITSNKKQKKELKFTQIQNPVNAIQLTTGNKIILPFPEVQMEPRVKKPQEKINQLTIDQIDSTLDGYINQFKKDKIEYHQMDNCIANFQSKRSKTKIVKSIKIKIQQQVVINSRMQMIKSRKSFIQVYKLTQQQKVLFKKFASLVKRCFNKMITFKLSQKEVYNEIITNTKPFQIADSRQFFFALKQNNFDDVENLIYYNRLLIFSFDETQQTCLHWCAKRGQHEMLQYFINLGANVDATDIMGRTPLVMATINNNLSSVLILLKNKANPYIRTIANKSAINFTQQNSKIYKNIRVSQMMRIIIILLPAQKRKDFWTKNVNFVFGDCVRF